MEPQRRRHREELLMALQSVAVKPMSFSGWVRLAPWQYTNEPLSAAGSLKNYGGRINIGQDVDCSAHESWPALYVAITDQLDHPNRPSVISSPAH